MLITNNKVVGEIVWTTFKAATKNLQQDGTSASGSGTTSLLSKNLTSHLLSVASEYGALTESTSGQTTTLSGSLDGIPMALEANSKGLFTECGVGVLQEGKCLPTKWFNSLGRVSYSVGINSSSGSALSGTATQSAQGNAQQASVASTSNSFSVSQITGKVILIQPKTPYTSFTKALQALEAQASLPTAGTKLQAAQDALIKLQQDSSGYNQFAADKSADLAKLSSDRIGDAWLALGPQLSTVLGSESDVKAAVLAFADAEGAYTSAERAFYEASQASKPVLTLEYDETRPTSQPTYSTAKVVYGQTVGKFTFTANGAFAIYDSAPSSSIPGASRLRDALVAIETDYALPKLGYLGSATLSGAYYFQDQTSPAILNVTPGSPVSGVSFTGLSSSATQVYAQKGQIHVGQIRLGLGSAASGFKFPIAFTFSNRTELITTPAFRAQIGISYDFDSLLP
jgi:hypothetical protein